MAFVGEHKNKSPSMGHEMHMSSEIRSSNEDISTARSAIDAAGVAVAVAGLTPVSILQLNLVSSMERDAVEGTVVAEKPDTCLEPASNRNFSTKQEQTVVEDQDLGSPLTHSKFSALEQSVLPENEDGTSWATGSVQYCLLCKEHSYSGVRRKPGRSTLRGC